MVEPDAHEDDVDKIVEESSREANEAVASSFELRNQCHDEGMFTSGTLE